MFFTLPTSEKHSEGIPSTNMVLFTSLFTPRYLLYFHIYQNPWVSFFLIRSLVHKIYHDSGIKNFTDLKAEPGTNSDKREIKKSKNFSIISWQESMMPTVNSILNSDQTPGSSSTHPLNYPYLIPNRPLSRRNSK